MAEKDESKDFSAINRTGCETAKMGKGPAGAGEVGSNQPNPYGPSTPAQHKNNRKGDD